MLPRLSDLMKRYIWHLTSAPGREGRPVSGGAAVLMCSYWSVCAYVLGGIQGKLDEGEGLYLLEGQKKEEE